MHLHVRRDSHHAFGWLSELDLKTALIAIEELREDADADALVELLYEEPVASCKALRLEAGTAAIQVLGEYGQWREIVELLDEEAVIADRRLQREATGAAIEELCSAGDPELLLSLLEHPVIRRKAIRRQAVVRSLMHRPQPGAVPLAGRCDRRSVETLCDLLRNDPDGAVRLAAAEALVACGDRASAAALEDLAAGVKSRRARRRIETTAERLREAVGTT